MNLTAFGMKAIKHHLVPECTFNLFSFPSCPEAGSLSTVQLSH